MTITTAPCALPEPIRARLVRVAKANHVKVPGSPPFEYGVVSDSGETEGRMIGVSKYVAMALALSLLAGCAKHPQTDQDLKGEAENAVDTKLDTQATFTLMEAIAARKIACGHASAPDAPGRGKVDQDFVYLDGRLIMDDEPDFDQAAIECDVAASGGNSSDLSNIGDS